MFSHGPIPGRLVKLELAARLQRRFVQMFAANMLPKIAPPFVGPLFQEAQRIPSAKLVELVLPTAGDVALCVTNELPDIPTPSFRRNIYVASTRQMLEHISHLGPALGHDLYIFDRSFRWFVAALEERVFQGSDDGEYVALYHHVR